MKGEQQVEAALKSYEDVDSWKTVIFLYNAALKEVGTKLEILNDEFQHVHQYNPIEHIKTRIKTPESIVKKLKRYGYETSIENMVRYINDIAGVRLICSFTSDIYRLAEMIGPERVIWRYDPVLLSPKYTVDFHRQRFSQMAKALAGSTKRCVISFLDMYPSMQKEAARLGLRAPDRQEAETLAAYFADIAAHNGIKAETCAENIDLAHLGIAHGCCIDKALLEKIGGFKLHTKKDLNQRPFCGCCASVDIGTYATCPGGCVYCYANRGAAAAKNAFAAHDAHALLLLGPLLPDDIVTEKVMRSEKDTQMQLFL